MGYGLTRQGRKGYARTTAPPFDIETAEEQIRRSSDEGSGRGFLYEWEERLVSFDSRLTALEAEDPGLTPVNLAFLTATPVEVKNDAGTLCGYMVFNSNSAPAFVQVFDALADDVVLGTTPAAYVLSIPEGAAANMAFPAGVTHDTGITVAATDAPDSASSPAIALNVSLFFR